MRIPLHRSELELRGLLGYSVEYSISHSSQTQYTDRL